MYISFPDVWKFSAYLVNLLHKYALIHFLYEHKNIQENLRTANIISFGCVK